MCAAHIDVLSEALVYSQIIEDSVIKTQANEPIAPNSSLTSDDVLSSLASDDASNSSLCSLYLHFTGEKTEFQRSSYILMLRGVRWRGILVLTFAERWGRDPYFSHSAALWLSEFY